MDERLEWLVMDFKAGRYTRRQFVQKALSLGLSVSALSALLEMVGKQPHAGMIPAAEAAAPQRTIVVGIAQPTTKPDPPIIVEYGDSIVINNNINEGVVRTKTGTTDIEPCLARSWNISADGNTYTFHLRPAIFHDGTPVKADAIKLNFDRQIDEKNPFHFSGMTMTEVIFGNISKIEAVDPGTLRITQTRPDVALLSNLALVIAAIVSPTALREYGKDYAMHPTGSGPYKFERWEKSVQFVETAFDRYWGGRSWMDRVIWKTVADNTVRLEQLRTGELDAITDLDFKDVDALAKDTRFKVIKGNFLNNQYIMLNGNKPPFDKKEVRQAIQFAVNKANIGKVLFYDNYEIGAGPLMPGQLGYDKSLSSVYPYDPARAKALLQKVGIGEGFSVTLNHRTHSFWPEEAQLVQSDLKTVGLNVTLQGLDDPTFFAKLNASEHQMALNDWTNDTGDPSNPMVTQFSTKRADARLGYKNPEVVRLNSEAQVERNPGKRRDLYIQAQRLLLEDAHYVTLGYPKAAMATKANFIGLLLSPLRDVVIRGVKMG